MGKILSFKMEKILLEILPPPITWDTKKREGYLASILQMTERKGVHTLTLPEIVDEKREKERTINFIAKEDVFAFSEALLKEDPQLLVIPNLIAPIRPLPTILQLIEKNNTSHLVLVGGESSKKTYPGPSVIETAREIKKQFSKMTLGGIAIFQRKEEAERIVKKAEAGISFFLSQILFETDNLKRTLLNLALLVEKRKVPFPNIYASLAPVTKQEDIAFMRWLGVDIPQAIGHYFDAARAEDLEERVLEVISQVLDEIVDFKRRYGFPIFFNVELVMYNHIKASEKIVQTIKSLEKV